MRMLAIVALLLNVPYAAAEVGSMSREQLYGLLDSMRSSTPYVNFEGIIVYNRANKTIPARIMRRGNVEKITFFSGYYKHVLNDGAGNTYLHSPSYYYKLPAGNIDHDPGHPPAATAHGSDSLRHYHLQLGGETTVAGRPAWIISAVPVDKWRYQHKFCIDKNTKLLLDVSVYDENLGEVENISYAALSFKAPPEPPTTNGGRQPGQPEQMGSAKMESTSKGRWFFTQDMMPPGFTPLRRSINIDHEQRSMEQWVITDGLIWVSVFVENFANDGQKAGDLRVAGLNMHTRKLNDTYITAVGMVPTTTLRSIARAIHTH